MQSAAFRGVPLSSLGGSIDFSIFDLSRRIKCYGQEQIYVLSSIAVFLAIGIAAGVLFDLVPDMPLGTTFDEAKKTYFVLNGTQDFKHPLLMLQFVRGANWFAGDTDLNSVLELGRTGAAIFGGLFVFFAMVLAWRVVGTVSASVVGTLTAAAPMTVLHAQLFKEDIFVAPMLLFSLLALVRLTEVPSWNRAFAFGASAGLAASAKYVGAIIIPLAVFVPAVCCRVNATYFRWLGVSIVTAVAVFLTINWNLLFQFSTFQAGLSSEIEHALSRHLTYMPGWMTGFTWEWSNGLIPGLQPLFAWAALGAVAVVLAYWRSTPPTIRLVLLFTFVWYFVHELSPMKPVVGGTRHMTVMAGTCAILVVYAIHRLLDPVRAPRKQVAVAAIASVIALPSLWHSISLARSVSDDTQIVAEAVVAKINGSVLWPTFGPVARRTAQYPSTEDAPGIRNLMTSYDYMVILESVAQQIIEANRLGHQPSDVREAADLLSKIMERPALLITSPIGQLSYRNLPLRIVALNGPSDQLAAAAVRRREWPERYVTLTYNPGNTTRFFESE